MQENKTLIIKTIQFTEINTLTFDSSLVILVESGGSKTDWRIKDNKQIIAFETINFHPKTIGEEQKNIIETLQKVIPQKSSLIFFGSGCLQHENQKIIENLFKPFELEKIEVKSDLLAAGKCIYGTKKGFVGILGTGSVLFKYQNENIDTLFGGFGFLIGDEGSGFYFGKLMLHKYLNQDISLGLKELFEEKYGERSIILAKIYGLEGKQFIGQIQLMSENKDIQKEINLIHEENIELFLSNYLPKNEKITQIGFVGSYAFYNQEILKKILLKRDIELKQIVQKPINELMKYYF